jgi:Holliday junction resolvasome RuvABC endonuclease subunit
MILGFDLSLSHSSCCALSDNDFVCTDFIPTPHKDKEGIVQTTSRMADIAMWVCRSINKFDPEAIGIEDIKMSFMKVRGKPIVPRSMTILAGLKWVVVDYIYYTTMYVPLMITASEARKEYFGKGIQNKEEVFQRLQKKYPQIENSHQADAYLIAKFIKERGV